MAPAHGVGSYLSVHEGPVRIAKPSYPGGGPQEPLREGMILSNEPGYYKAGDYGIRIENLMLVTTDDIAGGEAAMLGFETLTFVPIDRDLIVPALLTTGELSWLNAYHAQVAARIAPVLEGEERPMARITLRAHRLIARAIPPALVAVAIAIAYSAGDTAFAVGHFVAG